jgi:hypothetical protein
MPSSQDIKAVGTKRDVYNGKAKHTSGGLVKSDILKVSAGKRDGKTVYRYVSKKKHDQASKNIRKLSTWSSFVVAVKNHYGLEMKAAMKKASVLKRQHGVDTVDAFKKYVSK